MGIIFQILKVRIFNTFFIHFITTTIGYRIRLSSANFKGISYFAKISRAFKMDKMKKDI